MKPMRRIQIYLPPELSDALGRLARRRGTSRASLLRLAARRLLEQEQPGEEDPILGLIGLGNAGPGRASEDHDRLLVEHELHALDPVSRAVSVDTSAWYALADAGDVHHQGAARCLRRLLEECRSTHRG